MIKDYNINKEPITIKRALLSVYDKTEIKELALNLAKHNIEIISTGGTAKLLKKDLAQYVLLKIFLISGALKAQIFIKVIFIF